MNKPVPSPRMPAAGRDPSPARPDSLASKPSLQIKVCFYRVMKPRRVYPLVVELPRATAKPVAGQMPLIVKPVLAGAVVAPTEQALDVNAAGGRLTFQVTPLAKGRLKDSRIELVQQGKSVDRIPLRMRTKTQRLTWLLLLATLIVPGVLLYYTSIAPLTGDVPKPVMRKGLTRQRPAGGGAEPAPQAPEVEAPPALVPVPEPQPGTRAEVLQYKISRFFHENFPKPSFCERLIKDQPQPYFVVEPSGDADLVERAAYWAGYGYQYLCDSARGEYPAFFLAVVLGAFTLLSLVSHRTLRGKARKTGIRLADGTSSGGRPASREEPATIVEATD